MALEENPVWKDLPPGAAAIFQSHKKSRSCGGSRPWLPAGFSRKYGIGLFHFDQLIFCVPETNLHCVIDTGFPVGLRCNGTEMIVSFMIDFSQHAGGYGRLRVDGVGTGHIQGNRVEGGEHSHIRTIAISFSAWQSQYGETSMTREMWKCGLPSRTALLYSAIFAFRISKASSWAGVTASLDRRRYICRSPHICPYRWKPFLP